MKAVLLVFFISISMEPIAPGLDKSGRLIEVLLVGAPDREAAELWAREYGSHHLLKGESVRKISDLKVLPVSDTLLTHKGDELIEWQDLAQRLKDERSRDHWLDFSSAGIQIVRNEPKTEDAKAETFQLVRDAVGAAGDGMNWDESMQHLYLATTGNAAYVIESLNVMTCSIPLRKVMEEGTDEYYGINACPKVVEYVDGSAGILRN